MRLLAVSISTLSLLCACSMSGDTAVAEQAVPKFHEFLDAGRFAEIYEGASADLKNAGSQGDFVALLDAVHRKLGMVKSSEKQGWNVNYDTSGTFVTLTYKTTYAEGEAGEQFVYRIKGSAAALAGYHINSMALIVK